MTLKDEELTDPAHSLETLAWRLFHEEEEVRVQAGASLSRGCRCTAAHYETIIARFPPDEQEGMRGPDGTIAVDCAFCSRTFALAI